MVTLVVTQAKKIFLKKSTVNVKEDYKDVKKGKKPGNNHAKGQSERQKSKREYKMKI